MRGMTTGYRCPRCAMKRALCMCALLPQLPTRTQLSIVMHKLEAVKSTNTGRIAHACLPSSTLHMFGPDLPPLPARPWPHGCTPVVLFPVAGAQPVADFVGEKQLCVIVLDGSWRQAARMRKRFASQDVPFVTVTRAKPTIYRLRTEPHPGGVSTLEAVAAALGVLEGPHVEDALLHALQIFVDRTLYTRGALAKEAVTGGIPDGVLPTTL